MTQVCLIRDRPEHLCVLLDKSSLLVQHSATHKAAESRSCWAAMREGLRKGSCSEGRRTEAEGAWTQQRLKTEPRASQGK